MTERQEDQIDVRQYLGVLWRRRALLAAAALGCGGIALALWLAAPPLFEAQAALAFSTSKIADDPVGIGANGFRAFVESVTDPKRIVDEFRLGDEPYRGTPSSLFDSIVTVTENRAARMLTIRARLREPELAVRVANRVAELAVEGSRRLSVAEAARSQDDLKPLLDVARERLEQAEEQLRAYRDTAQVELVRKDVDALLGQRGEILKLLVAIESEKAKLAKAEEELASRQRLETVKRPIDAEPVLMESARKPPGETGEVMEVLNPVYRRLDAQIAESRTNLAALQRQKDQIVDVRKLDAARSSKLTRLYELEATLARLEIGRDAARRAYQEVANSYELARLKVASRGLVLQVIAPASTARPVARRPVAAALVASLGGLLVSSVAVLLFNALTS